MASRALTPQSALTLSSALVLTLGCGDSGSGSPDAAAGCVEDPAFCQASNAACGVLQRQDGPCVSCGRCALPLICGGGGRANQCGCTPRDCAAEGIQCGILDDGCGNPLNCGNCGSREVCLEQRCQPVIPLGGDCSLAPGGCEPGTMCCLVGTGNLCVTPTAQASCPAALPDLITREASTRGSLTVTRRVFEPTDCAIAEGCIGAPGDRRLLSFGTFIENVGRAALQLGAPSGSSAFVYDECTTHQHYHYADFMTYSVHAENPDGSLGPALAQTEKVSHCLEDGKALTPESPPSGGFSCASANSTQGLMLGWGYTYEVNVDCQWVDISDLAPGNYVLRIVIDPTNKIAEEREDNNTKTFNVTVPPP